MHWPRRLGRVVFIRHGESIWNCSPVRFTGWANVPLSDKGKLQAREVGNTLQIFGIRPDVVYTSLLRRSKESLDEIAKANELHYKNITQINSWRLNERHYGALVGLSKDEAAAAMGEEKVMLWRKSWDGTPPPMLKEDLYAYKEAPWAQPVTIVHKSNGTSTTHTEKDVSMPLTESLKDCCERVLPLWREAIYPRILAGETILIIAHANSIRAIVKHIDADTISDDCVRKINIPSAIPLVYDFAEAELEGELEGEGASGSGSGLLDTIGLQHDSLHSSSHRIPVVVGTEGNEKESAKKAAPIFVPIGKPNDYGMRGRYIASKDLIASLRKTAQVDHENDESLVASLDDSVAKALMMDSRSSGGRGGALLIDAGRAAVLREHYAKTALGSDK